MDPFYNMSLDQIQAMNSGLLNDSSFNYSQPQQVQQDIEVPNYNGTSFIATNMILLEPDGSMRLKVIRGFDSNTEEYSHALKNLLLSDTMTRSRLVNSMRSPNLLTISREGNIIDNPVVDNNIEILTLRNRGTLDLVGSVYAEIESNRKETGLMMLERTVILDASTLIFYDASNLDIDTSSMTIDITTFKDLVRPIGEMINELTMQETLDFSELQVQEAALENLDRPPAGMNDPHVMFEYMRKQVEQRTKEEEEMYSDNEEFWA